MGAQPTRGGGPPVNPVPTALTIAGSDSGGGAGIQADLLTFSALGVFGTTAISCLTAQNPDEVTAVHPVPVEFRLEQIRRVEVFFEPNAVKTGMLFSAEIICAVADWLETRGGAPAVVDPVMVATSGAVLLEPDAVEAVRERLIPSATLVTPNLDEANVLAGGSPSSADGMADAARALASRFGTAFLLKGGHLPGDELVDALALADGSVRLFRDPRIHGVDTHGTGCTLAAAVAAGLAKGIALEAAVAASRAHLRRAMAAPVILHSRAFLPQGGAGQRG